MDLDGAIGPVREVENWSSRPLPQKVSNARKNPSPSLKVWIGNSGWARLRQFYSAAFIICKMNAIVNSHAMSMHSKQHIQQPHGRH